MKTSPQKKTCTSMFNAALFILASNLKQSKYSQQDNGGLFMKRNTMQQLRKAMNTHKNTDFKSIFLSERSQTHRELNSRTSRRVYGNRRSAVTWGILYVLIGMLVTRLQMSFKTHRPIHLKLMHFIIHNLCLNEDDILEKPSMASHYTQNLSSAGVSICPQLTPHIPLLSHTGVPPGPSS